MGKLINHLGVLLDVENTIEPEENFDLAKALYFSSKLIWCRYSHTNEISKDLKEIVLISCMNEFIIIGIDNKFNIKYYKIPDFDKYK